MANGTYKQLPPTEVLIVGAGPTGCMLSYCLSKWGHSIRLVDDRPEALKSGRADGIQPHTLDVFVNLGLHDDFRSYNPSKFDTVAFWDPREDGPGIAMTSKAPTCPPDIGARYPCTTTLHQGYIESMMLKHVDAAGGDILRPWTIESWEVDADPATEYPVHAVLKDLHTGARAETRAKYLVGAQGGKSSIRDQLAIPMIYYTESLQPTVWGVIDAEVETDFPGIAWKNNIHSPAGSMMIIPREHGLVRFYIQTQHGLDEEISEAESRKLAQEILKPYKLNIGHCDWASTYKVGQGRAKHYGSPDLRVFIGGDTCHTHSPKAGQGMNTGMLDAVNLAWKVHLVEAGMARRELLATYEAERQPVAKALLDFDAKYTQLFAQKRSGKSEGGDDEFIKTAAQNVHFTSGYGTHYSSNMLNMTHENAPDAIRSLLFPAEKTKLEAGAVFPCADVRRVADRSTVQLEQALPMNGGFRLLVYAGDQTDSAAKRKLEDFARYAGEEESKLSGLTAMGEGPENGVTSRRFLTTALIYASVPDTDASETMLPSGLKIAAGNVFADDAKTEWRAYGKAGLQASTPAAVIVRPDGHIGCVLRLEGAKTAKAIGAYFTGVGCV